MIGQGGEDRAMSADAVGITVSALGRLAHGRTLTHLSEVRPVDSKGRPFDPW